jgi:tripartite-type tricarboxylate transporter receptor subunit TctC
MQAAISKIVLEPETRKMLIAQGLDAVGSTQEEFAKVYADELVRWGKVVQAVGITLK